MGSRYCRDSWCSKSSDICGNPYSTVKFCLSSVSLCETKCVDRRAAGPACKGIAFTRTPEGDEEQCGILKLGRCVVYVTDPQHGDADVRGTQFDANPDYTCYRPPNTHAGATDARLAALYLNDNAITAIAPGGVFAGLNTIGEIRLEGNRITTLTGSLVEGIHANGTISIGLGNNEVTAIHTDFLAAHTAGNLKLDLTTEGLFCAASNGSLLSTRHATTSADHGAFWAVTPRKVEAFAWAASCSCPNTTADGRNRYLATPGNQGGTTVACLPVEFSLVTVPGQAVGNGTLYSPANQYIANDWGVTGASTGTGGKSYSYLIAPLKIDRSRTMVVKGAASDVSFKLVKHTAGLDGFYVDSSTGEVFGRFTAFARYPGIAVMDLVAMDASGAEDVVQRFDFVVDKPPSFKYVTVPGTRRTGGDYTDTDDAGVRFIVGTSYRIAPLKLDAGRTVLSLGLVTDIAYTIQGDTKGFYVSSTTGEIFGRFAEASTGRKVIKLVAHDASGAMDDVEVYRFDVRPKPRFDLTTMTSRISVAKHSHDVDYGLTSTPYVRGVPYRILPLDIDANRTVVSAGTVQHISYRLEGDSDGFYVNSKTGIVYGSFPRAGDYGLELYAVDLGGEKELVQRYVFRVQDPAVLKINPEVGWEPGSEASKAGFRRTYIAGPVTHNLT